MFFFLREESAVTTPRHGSGVDAFAQVFAQCSRKRPSHYEMKAPGGVAVSAA